MSGAVTSLERARRAKQRGKELLAGLQGVSGIGLTGSDDDFAISVNLESELPDPSVIPSEIEGVPVVVRVVGRIHKQ